MHAFRREGKQSMLIALCLIFFPLYKVYISAPDLMKAVKNGVSEQWLLGFREKGVQRFKAAVVAASITFMSMISAD